MKLDEITYVSSFSTRAAVNFRIKSLDKTVKFKKVLVYEKDKYGVSDDVFFNQINIPIFRKNIYFIFYGIYIFFKIKNIKKNIFLKAFPANILAAFLLKINGNEIIFDLDEMDSFTQLDVKKGWGKYLSYLLWRINESLAIFIADKFIITNVRISKFLKGKPYLYLPNCINGSEFIITKFFDNKKDKNIIYAGSFHESSSIINLFKNVDKEYKIILIGDGKELEIVEKFLKTNNYNYESYGYLKHNKLVEIFCEIKGVFIAPYRKTVRVKFSSSGKIPMYMITGCPIIVSNVEGPLDFDENENLFYKYNEERDIVGIIEKIFLKNDFNKSENQFNLTNEKFNYEKRSDELKKFIFDKGK